jgi:hypothetical protein
VLVVLGDNTNECNVPNWMADFPIDQLKSFFEILTVRMERDTTNCTGTKF